MLPHPTLDNLQTLRLTGMLKALAEQLKTPDIDSLSFCLLYTSPSPRD